MRLPLSIYNFFIVLRCRTYWRHSSTWLRYSVSQSKPVFPCRFILDFVSSADGKAVWFVLSAKLYNGKNALNGKQIPFYEMPWRYNNYDIIQGSNFKLTPSLGHPGSEYWVLDLFLLYITRKNGFKSIVYVYI